MIFIQTLLITEILHLMMAMFLHSMSHIIQILPQRKKKRKQNSRKRKSAVPSEWKLNKTKSLRNTGHTYRTLK